MGFHERVMRSGGVAAVSGWQVKQYRLTVGPEPIEPAVVSAAGAFLPSLLPAPSASDGYLDDWLADGPVGRP